MGSTAGILFFRTFSEIRPGIFTTRGGLRQSDTFQAFLMGPFHLRIRVPAGPAPLYPRYSGPEVAVGGANAMKSCPHCSASLEEDAVRCRRCGKWVVGERNQRKPNKKAGRTRKHLLILGALVLLAWALWGIPENTINPREILDLRPRRGTILSAMESDLQNLAALQAEHYRTQGSYSGNPSALGFTASDGMNLSLIATPTGWSASATHEEHPPEVGCAVYGGSASPPRSPISPAEPGVIECTGR